MNKEIIINTIGDETRIAITEDGLLTEYFVEHADAQRSVGDIYLGRVAKIIPGIKAAFIDVGHKQDAFLHFSDIDPKIEELNALIGDEDTDVDLEEEEEESNLDKIPIQTNSNYQRSIQNLPKLEKGKEIIVQVTKEPVGNKGFRVTTRITLPGRFLVLLPFDNKIGVSKKIHDPRKRKRLRKIVRSIIPEGFGVIVRTVAANEDEETIKEELNRLLNTWKEIEQTIKNEKAPALVYKDASTTSSVIRDLFNYEVSKIIVDSKKVYKQLRDYLHQVHPELEDRIELYKGKEPIFDVFGIEPQLRIAMSRKVPLPSGGHIVIDQTEAMTVIDVNTGKYAASMHQELNSLKIDLEAAREICRQVRLRDIGGIIIIDFIDLEEEKNKKKVFDELKKEFRKDRAKVSILPMTEFGLVQITRQRVRKSIFQRTRDVCPTCGGTGILISKESLLKDIEHWLRRFKLGKFLPKVTLKINPFLENEILKGFIPRYIRWSFKFRVRLNVELDVSLKVDEFRFFDPVTGKDITTDY
ncbi:MAG: Rne/Rng family ribonuclease [Ignavibacteria bacterium]|jgi:ribonuclease G|nr:Rne/Rng family ribonuclease [Ignavibacteria bacterium]MDH7527700.1 Rne/Rng family ribonuclease [Ignavibacteria bacterium]NPV10938.1 Rne/Rng family ribonuclease [Ignavibacteria bacterium]